MQPNDYDYKFKIIIDGHNLAGKTSLIQQFTSFRFSKSALSTIGVDFSLFYIPIDNFLIKLELWDFGGGERFRAIIYNYYRGAHGFILVYDITNRSSFLYLATLIEKVKDMPLLIVGNKADLEKKREVSYEEANEFGKTVGAKVIEASAKDNMNVEDIFSTIVRQIGVKLGIKGQSPKPRLVVQPEPELKSVEVEAQEEPVRNLEYDEICKMVMVGDSGVGKSNMLLRLCKGEFISDHMPTIGKAFDKIVTYKDKRIKLQIWDSAGESKHRGVTRDYYPQADAIIFVYDISNRNSFESLDSWVQDVSQHNGDGALKIVIGNKNDLEGDRKVSYEEGKTYAEKIEGYFFETSAKDEETFEKDFLGAFHNILDSLGIEIQ